MATSGDKFLKPGICGLDGCDVALLLDDKSILYACKHKLAGVSDEFRKMFTQEFEEKYKRRIEFKDVSKEDLLVFLSITQEPLTSMPSDADSLCSLIFLANRFMCPGLKKDIETHLGNESMFQAPLDAKLQLLETADKYKGESTGILEVCIRLCADLDWDTLAGLRGKVAEGTWAALVLLVGRVNMKSIPLPKHRCSCVNYANECRFDGIAGRQYFCNHGQSPCRKSDYNVDFEKVKEIEVDKNMLA